MNRARIDDVELEYDERGSGEPMLLVHGAHFADAMRPLALEPALAGFRSIWYHRRGYAGSTHVTGPVTVETYASEAVALLDHLGIAKAHVVGHSSGGLIALGVVLGHASRVQTLTLLEPPILDGPLGATFMEALEPVLARYASGDAAGAVHDFIAAVGDDGWQEAVERTVPGGIEQAERDATTFFESELPGVGAWRFGPTEAARITVPTLLVEGTRSAPLFTESDTLLRSWLPSYRDATITGATHLLQMEQPTAVAEAIDAFCSVSTVTG